MTDTPLGILVLSGRLPFAVADAVIGQGRPVFLVGLKGLADPARIADYPHDWAAPIQVGRVFRLFRAKRCHDLVFAGAMLRPRLGAIRFDLGTLRMLRVLLASQSGGDDGVLARVTAAVEGEGFRVLGLHDVAPSLVAPDGPITAMVPDDQQRADAKAGFALLRSLGPHDVGQSCIVHRGRVIAVEAAEGTSEMVRRVAALRAAGRFPVDGRAGVLVKAPKPQQELRNDMPVIGPETVEAAAAVGLAGIVWASGGVLLIDAGDMARQADRGGLFLAGLPDTGP